MSVNEELVRERNGASFDSEKLTNFIDGSQKQTHRRRYIQNLAGKDKLKYKRGATNWFSLTREQKFDNSIYNSILCDEKIEEYNLKDELDKLNYTRVFLSPNNNHFGLHFSMFIETIRAQGSKEQVAKWLPKCENMDIIGTYAQTELGHGTFIRGLETTATYDPKSEEFIINSPTTTSIKFWPGQLGLTTNYAIIMAQLYSLGKKHGIQAFLVQLRSEENHQPLPGVELGDIGDKFGFDVVDNGFARFSNVRIPRENMLMKFSQVEKDGRFVKPQHTKLLYGSMLAIRAALMIASSSNLQIATTIAVRYSAVRRQTEVKPGGEEAQVLDYQTQQEKLFPALATAFAYLFCGRELYATHNRVKEEIGKGSFEELPQLHALSSGLKAFSTWTAVKQIEVCRMSCGGHGYSNASGLPYLYANFCPACTYEGENTVMALQAARYLMKCSIDVRNGKALPGFVEYLGKPLGKLSDIDESMKLSTLVDIYQHRASRQVRAVSLKLQKLISSGKSAEDAWNLCSAQLVRAAMAHCHGFVVKSFTEVIKSNESLDPAVKRVLNTLCLLYCVHGILENLGDFIQDGYVNGRQVDILENKYTDLLAALRPDGVAIVDSFDIPDSMLNSALGRYDGNVYEAMYQYAKDSPLNKTEVHHSYHKYIRPLLKGEKISDSKL